MIKIRSSMYPFSSLTNIGGSLNSNIEVGISHEYWKGLRGQIIVNAANGSGQWNGSVKLLDGAGQDLTLSPVPNYSSTPSEIGYGAVGEVPFMLHESGTSPANGSSSADPVNDVVLRFYGPIAALIEITRIDWDPASLQWIEVGTGRYYPPVAIWQRDSINTWEEGPNTLISDQYDYTRVPAYSYAHYLTGLKIFKEDENGDPLFDIFEHGKTYRILPTAALECDTLGTPNVSPFIYEFTVE